MKFDKLLGYAEHYGFDVVPYEINGRAKRPLVPNWNDEALVVKETPIAQQHFAIGEGNIGVVMKKETGLRLKDRQLVVIDIDDKDKTGIGEEIFNTLTQELCSAHDMNFMRMSSVSETTKNGGYHIFLTTDVVRGTDKILVEQTSTHKVEIEVFTGNRGLITAPSDGYKCVGGTIDFDNVYDCYVKYSDLMKILNKFRSLDDKQTDDVAKGKGFSLTDAPLNTAKIKKTEKEWDKFQRFINGNGDSDWDSIDDDDPRLYVAHNIMPWMVETKQVELFIDTIKRYGGEWIGQWINFPTKWKAMDFKERPYGKDVREMLIKCGLAEKESNKVPNITEYATGFIREYAPNVYRGSFFIEGTLYTYCDKDKYVKPLTTDAVQRDLLKYVEEFFGTRVVNHSVAQQVMKTVYMYLDKFNHDKKCEWVNPYSIQNDVRYLDRVPVVFNNGTLYVGKIDGNVEYTFEEDHFSVEDVAMFKIDTDYTDRLVDFTPSVDSPVHCWFGTRFPNAEVLKFIKMFLGSTFVPAYNPEVLLSIFTPKGGTGKSTLLNTLRTIFDPLGSEHNKVTDINIDKLGERFIGSDLATSLLNLSAETDKKLDSERIKSIISREVVTMERKGVDAFPVRPLSKHIAMANKRPEYVNDGGMERRVAVFEANPTVVMPQVEANAFGRMFVNDWETLVSIILEGLTLLVEQDFPNLSTIWHKSPEYAVHRNMQNENTSSVSAFLSDRGYYEILNGELTASELYASFKMWCKENDILNPPVRKHFIGSLKAGAYVNLDSKKRKQGGKGSKVVDIHDDKKRELIEYIAETVM